MGEHSSIGDWRPQHQHTPPGQVSSTPAKDEQAQPEEPQKPAPTLEQTLEKSQTVFSKLAQGQKKKELILEEPTSKEPSAPSLSQNHNVKQGPPPSAEKVQETSEEILQTDISPNSDPEIVSMDDLFDDANDLPVILEKDKKPSIHIISENAKPKSEITPKMDALILGSNSIPKIPGTEENVQCLERSFFEFYKNAQSMEHSEHHVKDWKQQLMYYEEGNLKKETEVIAANFGLKLTPLPKAQWDWLQKMPLLVAEMKMKENEQKEPKGNQERETRNYTVKTPQKREIEEKNELDEYARKKKELDSLTSIYGKLLKDIEKLQEQSELIQSQEKKKAARKADEKSNDILHSEIKRQEIKNEINEKGIRLQEIGNLIKSKKNELKAFTND